MARHLSPQDVVPRLRTDLNVTAPPTGAGAEVIQVGPIGSTDRFELHGFEFQIALMLDGRRTVADLVRACDRLGLPVEIEALEGFFEQLKGYGLLAKGKAPAQERTRRDWSPVVRALFRDALNEVRKGEPAEARADLEQLLKVAPQTREAIALRAWLDANPTGAPDHETFEHLLQTVEAGWLDDRKPAWRETVRAAIHRSRWPAAILLLAVAPLVALAVLPLPRVVSASAKISPVSELAFFSPATGVVDEVRVRDGDRVEAGDVLFTWDAADLDLRLFRVKNRLEAARAPLREEAGATPEGREWWVRLQAAEADAARARAVLWAHLEPVDGAEPDPAAAQAAKRLQDAEARAELARAALDSLSATESPAALRVRPYELELAALEQQRSELEVRAPRGGVVSQLNVIAGRPFSEQQTVAKIDDTSRLKVIAVTTTRQAAAMHPGEPVTLRFGAVRAKTTIEAVSEYEIGAEIDNPGGLLKTGSMPVDLELEPSSFVSRLLR